MASDKQPVDEKQTQNKGKGLLQIAEVRMLLYIVPVAIVLLVIALILN